MTVNDSLNDLFLIAILLACNAAYLKHIMVLSFSALVNSYSRPVVLIVCVILVKLQFHLS